MFSAGGSGAQLDSLLASCSVELSVIAGACIDIVRKSIQSTVQSTDNRSDSSDSNDLNTKKTPLKAKKSSGSKTEFASEHSVYSSEDNAAVIMASTCVRWLVVAFPSPLLTVEGTTSSSSSTTEVVAPSTSKKGKEKEKGQKQIVSKQNISLSLTNNSEEFALLLTDLTSTMTYPTPTPAPTLVRTSEARTSSGQAISHSLAHHTQLIVSVLSNNTFTCDLGSENKRLSQAVSACQGVLPTLVKKYTAMIIDNPYSVVSVWGILGTLL